MSVAQYRELLATGRLGGTTIAGARPRNSPEEDLHRACFEWIELMTPQNPVLHWLVHVPNGGKRPRGEAGKLKAMGAKPGVPDFMLPRLWRGWTGLAVELKSDTGRVTAAQQEWLDALGEDGYLCAVCRTLLDFELVVKRFLSGRPAGASHNPGN